MNSSPWAKFTTSMMPKISVRPEATSARIMPVTMPFSVWIRNRSNGKVWKECEDRMPSYTPRYCLMTASSTLSSDGGAWWRTAPFSMM